MDRASQAIALLRENSGKGLSFYDYRQLLKQNGFNDTEIDDALDKFSNESTPTQNAQTATMNNTSGLSPKPQSSPIPAQIDSSLPSTDSGDTKNLAQRYAVGYSSQRIKTFTLFITFVLVFVVGNHYEKHRSILLFALYTISVGISLFVAVYINLIRNIQNTTGSERAINLVIGSISCAVCVLFLGYISLIVLR